MYSNIFEFLLGYFPSPCNIGDDILQKKASLMVRTDRHSAHLSLKVQRNKLFCMEYFSTYSILLFYCFSFGFVFLPWNFFCLFPDNHFKNNRRNFCALRFSHLASVIATPCLVFIHLLFSVFTFQIFNRFFTWDGLKNPDHTGWERWTSSVESKGAK